MNGNGKKVRTVLMVDEDREMLGFFSRIIGSEYPVLSVTNGKDAIRTAQRANPDLIVLDVAGQTNFSTFAELQDDPITHDIPVLMLTAASRGTNLSSGSYMLMDAVRDVLNGGSCSCVEVAGMRGGEQI